MEVPDTLWGRIYYAWAVAELARTPTDTDKLEIMLTDKADFRAPGNARVEAARCLCALVETGKPPIDHVIQVLGIEG